MLKVYRNRAVTRFCLREGVGDTILLAAAREIEAGLIHADLGGGFLKHRLPGTGRGKSGGHRVVLAYRMDDRLIFLFAFSKGRQANISPAQLKDLRSLAADLLKLSAGDLDRYVVQGSLIRLR